MNNTCKDTDQAVMRILEKVLRKPSGSLRDDAELDSLSGWDSLAMIEFVAMADSQFGIDVPDQDVRVCTRISDLSAYIHTRM